MRFMVLVKASKNSEAGVMPSQQLLTEMGKFNEELTKAGVMLAGEGLQPSSKGARVRFSGEKRMVIDGHSPRPKSWLPDSGSGSASRCKRRSIGSSAVPIPCRAKRLRSRSARCSKPRISAPSSHLSSASRKSGSAHRSSNVKARDVAQFEKRDAMKGAA